MLLKVELHCQRHQEWLPEVVESGQSQRNQNSGKSSDSESRLETERDERYLEKYSRGLMDRMGRRTKNAVSVGKIAQRIAAMEDRQRYQSSYSLFQDSLTPEVPPLRWALD